jgi:hypothetical protein
MLTVIITIAFAIIVLYLTSKYVKGAEDARDEHTRKHTETICGNCGGPDCIVGCDEQKPDEHAHSHDVSKITSASFIKLEKERIVTADEIRYTAYLIASADNFSKNPEHYWIEAEKQLRSGK